MASSYPGGIDSFATNHLTGDVIAAATDNDQADAINKIETELGINPSGASATVLARLDAGDSALTLLKSRLPLNVKDYGAVGDGAYHPLSSVYGTLGAAQAVYPFATSLTQQLDWAGIQLAINTAMGAQDPTLFARYPTRSVYVPGGTYYLSDPLNIVSCNGFVFEGAGAGATLFYITGNMTNVINCNGTTASVIGNFVLRGAAGHTGTATTTSGSTSLTSVTPTTSFTNGSPITGAGIQSGTWIVSGAGTATMVMSKPATASASGVTISSIYSCTNALNVDWIAAESARSSEFCTFHDIDIAGEMNFVNGVAIGTVNGGADVYHHRFIGVRAYGGQDVPVNFTGTTTNGSPIITSVSSTVGLYVGQTVYGGSSLSDTTIVSIDSGTQITVGGNAFASGSGKELTAGGWANATRYQAAFRHGQGAQGNVIFNLFFGCNGGHCRRGFWTTAAGADWWGGSLQANDADIYVDGAGNDRMIHFDGVRSEVSAQLLDGTNGGKQDLLISNYAFYSDKVKSHSRVVTWVFGGVARLESVTITGSRAQLSPTMFVGYGSSYTALSIDGMSIDAASPFPSTWLTAHANCAYTVTGVQALTASQPTAPGLMGPITNKVTGTVASAGTITLPEDVQLVTVSGTTTITSIDASWAGREATLVFSGATTLTKGSNLAIDRDYVTTAGDTISLLYDGTNWIEQGRSVESRGLKRPVRAASVGNVTIASPGAAIDGVTLSAGPPADRVLLKDQTTASQNGIYQWNGAAVAMTRTTDADTAVKLTDSLLVTVDEGTMNADTVWSMSTPKPITLGTTALRFGRLMPGYNFATRDPWSHGGNAIAATMDRNDVTNLIAQTAITAVCSLHGGMVVPGGRLITNINAFCTAAGAGAVTLFWWALVRQSDRVVLQRTVNSTTLPTVDAVHTRALQAAITLDYDTPCYIALATQVATTSPSFAGVTGLATSNFATPILTGNSSTTPTSTPPTVGAVLGAPAAGNTGRIHAWLS